MSEKCPLEKGLYWDNQEYARIPEVCQIQCGDIWEDIIERTDGGIELFDSGCAHDVEYGGTSLQRPYGSNKSERDVGVLSVCTETGDDVFASNLLLRMSF